MGGAAILLTVLTFRGAVAESWADHPTETGADLRVSLPPWADGPVRLATSSGVGLSFALQGAAPRPQVATVTGAVYPHALGAGAHLWQQKRADGVEDFLLFPERPPREAVDYTIRPEGVAGLRLVANVLEFLDAAGVPRLRMAPPFLLDSTGVERQPRVAIHGCAYDADPRGPWGRPVVAPGSAACIVQVAWEDLDVVYPAVLDPAWTATGTMTTARKTHGAVTLPDGKILVMGGESPAATTYASAELYDPASKTWSPTGTMASSRQYFTVTLFRVGGQPRVLVTAGGANNIELAASETYDPATGVWTSDREMTQARRFHTASLLGDGRVLVTGGLVGKVGFAGGLASTEIYDPATGGWSTGNDLQAGRAGHTASVLTSGNVLLTGGYTSGVDTLASTEVYNVAAGTWEVGATMETGRAGHTATVLADGQVLVVGGLASGFTFLSTAERVQGNGKQSTPTAPLANTRVAHTATLLPDGRVLVVGGQGSATQGVTKTEIYDPVTGTWSLAGSVLQSRAFHTASWIFDGKAILVAGGALNNVIYDSVETFAIVAQGGSCVDNGECATGFCSRGVCCDVACSGPCQSCAALQKGSGVDGTCENVRAGQTAPLTADGKNPCQETDQVNQITCGQDGVCDGQGACRFVPRDTACGTTSCPDGTAVELRCDGAGTCRDPCPPLLAASCDGDHTLTNPTGSNTDCTPYKCAGTGCKTICDSVDDCVLPNLCDGRTRTCLAARDSAQVDRGCSCQLPGSSGGRSWPGGTAMAWGVAGLLGLKCRARKRVWKNAQVALRSRPDR